VSALNLAACTRAPYVDLDRIRRTIDEGPYDAVLALAPENVPYYSGFYNIDLRLLPERLHVCIWPRGGEPALVVVERRARLLRPDETYLTDIRGYQGEGLDAMRAVAEVLRDRGVDKGLIGYEARSFPGGQLVELMRLLPGLRFEDAYHFLEGPRVIKTPAEVEVMTRVNRMTTDAIDTAFRAVRIGDTERSVEVVGRHGRQVELGDDVLVAHAGVDPQVGAELVPAPGRERADRPRDLRPAHLASNHVAPTPMSIASAGSSG